MQSAKAIRAKKPLGFVNCFTFVKFWHSTIFFLSKLSLKKLLILTFLSESKHKNYIMSKNVVIDTATLYMTNEAFISFFQNCGRTILERKSQYRLLQKAKNIYG
jgi:hypothetical protein